MDVTNPIRASKKIRQRTEKVTGGRCDLPLVRSQRTLRQKRRGKNLLQHCSSFYGGGSKYRKENSVSMWMEWEEDKEKDLQQMKESGRRMSVGRALEYTARIYLFIPADMAALLTSILPTWIKITINIPKKGSESSNPMLPDLSLSLSLSLSLPSCYKLWDSSSPS
jgi:hypothetical protein